MTRAEADLSEKEGRAMAIVTEWFEAAVHPGNVRSVLAREISEFASGVLTLRAVEVKRLRSAEPEGYWTATYVMTVEGPSAAPQTLSAQGLLFPPHVPAPEPAAPVPLGTDGWACYVDELRLQLRTVAVDSALPGLALLTDPDDARILIERVLREQAGGLENLRLHAVAPEVMDHKLGVRCTVLCRLEYPPDAADDERGPSTVVAKVHQAEAAARTHHAMNELWASPLSRSEHVTIARPLAFVPELGLLVQSAVPEDQNLKELIHSALLSEQDSDLAELETALRMTARGLADLHRCGARHGGFVTWSEELAILRSKQAKLAGVMPRLADFDGTVFDRLEAGALAAPPDPFVAVHHSFRPAQVLLAAGGISFIDFDKSCQSEAASDLAMFTTKLRHASLNKLHAGADDDEDDEILDRVTRLQRIHRADVLCEIFVEEYGRCAPVSRRRIALWEALELFSLILSAAKKVKAGRVDSCAFMLEEHLRRNGL
jgi:hypothetical protein